MSNNIPTCKPSNEDELIELYQPIVTNMARTIFSKKLYAGYANNIGFEDIKQEMFIGLIKAYRQFDSNKGTQFKTFAINYIKYWAYKGIRISDAKLDTIRKTNYDIYKKAINPIIFNYNDKHENKLEDRMIELIDHNSINGLELCELKLMLSNSLTPVNKATAQPNRDVEKRLKPWKNIVTHKNKTEGIYFGWNSIGHTIKTRAHLYCSLPRITHTDIFYKKAKLINTKVCPICLQNVYVSNDRFWRHHNKEGIVCKHSNYNYKLGGFVILTVSQAATYLGRSKSYIRSLIKHGKINSSYETGFVQTIRAFELQPFKKNHRTI